MSTFDTLPDAAFLRESQLVQSPKRPNSGAPLPFSVPTFRRRIVDGTPRADEQAGIARRQQPRIHIAAASHDVVVADTTALMTAVYSRLYFNDDLLVPTAIAAQKSVALSLLTAIDIPWVADGHQRDGPQLRRRVDSALRDLLVTHRLPWAWVTGVGDLRIGRALDAVALLLRARASP